jgi:peptide/nickel transport system substrate-binding protein
MVLLPPLQFQEEVLLRRNFDIYVSTIAIPQDPGFLRSLLHSRYTDRIGWSNPFGYGDETADRLLDRQRHETGAERIGTFGEIQNTVVTEQPFVPLVREQAIAAVRTERFEGWSNGEARDPLWLLNLERTDVRPDDDSLTIATTFRQITETANPLRPRFTEIDPTTSMLYDPLARYYDGAFRPWLAESWTWNDESGTVEVVLGPDLQWHDGRPLRAEDVAFTYRFLADTSLGDGDDPYPAPRFQDRVTVVDGTEVLDGRTLRIEVDADGSAAARALNVPLLPEHVWASRSEITDPQAGLTSAVTWENPEPIGCGPLAFEERNRKESIRLSRFDAHPLNREEPPLLNERFSPLAFDEVQFRVVSSAANTLDLLDEELADATTPDLRSSVVARIDRSDHLSLLSTPSRTVYHVGFDTRERPLSNPGFRRAVASILDKSDIAESTFDGFADPVASPLIDTTWVPESLRWRGTDPVVPFVGSDGEMDVERARREFTEAGFIYSEDVGLIYE